MPALPRGNAESWPFHLVRSASRDCVRPLPGLRNRLALHHGTDAAILGDCQATLIQLSAGELESTVHCWASRRCWRIVLVHAFIELAHVGEFHRARATHAWIRRQRISDCRCAGASYINLAVVPDSRPSGTGRIDSAELEWPHYVLGVRQHTAAECQDFAGRRRRRAGARAS